MQSPVVVTSFTGERNTLTLVYTTTTRSLANLDVSPRQAAERAAAMEANEGAVWSPVCTQQLDIEVRRRLTLTCQQKWVTCELLSYALSNWFYRLKVVITST